MRFFKRGRFAPMTIACVLAGLLSACGGQDEPRILTAEEQELADIVTARRANLQDLGAAFKAIGDEMKAGRPTSPTVEFSIRAAAGYAPKLRNWFPEGSGPELGVKTEAAPAIWTDAEGFEQALVEFEDAVALLAKERGDADRLSANFATVGASCKSCHDGYRIEK